MLAKDTCEGGHLIVKLSAISLQASKFTENDFLHTYFSTILARFELLFIVLFVGIISWNGASSFNGGFVFQMEGFIFKWGVGCPWGASVLVGGGVLKKILR